MRPHGGAHGQTILIPARVQKVDKNMSKQAVFIIYAQKPRVKHRF